MAQGQAGRGDKDRPRPGTQQPDQCELGGSRHDDNRCSDDQPWCQPGLNGEDPKSDSERPNRQEDREAISKALSE
jgi:hypothetical protein